LFINDKGVQDIRGEGRKRFVYIGLRDLSAKLRKVDEANDWTASAVFTYSVVCDKTQAEKSLVHNIAERTGLSVNDIDCSTIPVTLPFVRLRNNLWAELSSLATAYRCHLECTADKSLVFVGSPYQTNEQCIENSYLIKGKDIFYLRITSRADLYRNSVRLKVNMPVSLEKQEIWRYDDLPVFYDDFYQAYYPFRFPIVREIENGRYEADYKVIDESGKERNVVFADEIDTQDEAENRLEYDVAINSLSSFSYSFYDVTSHFDKAILTLAKEADGDLYKAAIYGRPIVLDLNRSSFLTDSEAVAAYGMAVLNITGSYFSEYEIENKQGLRKPQYEDWVIRELAERLQTRREFTVKTHRALFHARVGAYVKLAMRNEQLEGVINSFSLRYKRDAAFVASFKILEE
jgi:hypothetical protein